MLDEKSKEKLNSKYVQELVVREYACGYCHLYGDPERVDVCITLEGEVSYKFMKLSTDINVIGFNQGPNNIWEYVPRRAIKDYDDFIEYLKAEDYDDFIEILSDDKLFWETYREYNPTEYYELADKYFKLENYDRAANEGRKKLNKLLKELGVKSWLE